MRTSFREIATYMDSVETPLAMQELFNLHVGDHNNSFDEIVRRHSNNQRLEKKFLTQNTFCMDANAIGKKPYAKIRAGLWGQHIKENYDISLLQEIFEDYIRDKFLSAWGENEGPLYFVDDTSHKTPASSGLMTISKDPISGKVFHEYDAESSIVFRIDIEADKGVLLTKYQLDTNHNIELYNTHLDSRTSSIRTYQVNELLTFIRNNHENTNLAILAGDFNIQSRSPNYQILRDELLRMGFIDVWEARNGYTGGTNLSEKDSQKYARIMCPTETNSRFCIDENIDESEGDRRIDYLFIKSTNTNCPYIMDITRPRRLIIRNNLGSTTFEYMSDHLGIHTELLINRIE